MTRDSTAALPRSKGPVDEAFEDVRKSFERFCLAAGVEALGTMMEADVEAACGARHARTPARRAHRWGRTQGRLGFQGGKIAVERPRIRGVDGREIAIPSWEGAAAEDWLGRWAMNQMLINVSTRKFASSVRLPEGDIAAGAGTGLSKSAASRRPGRADFPHPALGQDLTPSPTTRRAQAGSDVRARSARKDARVDSSRPCSA